MKGNKKILILLIAFLLTATTLITSTFAWITSLNRSGNIIFVTGEVKYVLTGSLEEYNLIIPETPLIKDQPYVLTNQSSIDSELRIKILYQFSEDEEIDENAWLLFDEKSIGDSPTNKLAGKLNSEGTFSYSNGFWYYSKDNNSTILAGDEVQITILEELYANGLACGNNECSKKNLYIKIVFQAKQKNYVTWEELGSTIDVA